MFHVLIDTSVWLDLAQDPKQVPLLESLDLLIMNSEVELLVPALVLSEFKKNRERVAERSRKSLTSHFQQVKDAIKKSEGDDTRKTQMLEYLSNMDHMIPLAGAKASSTLDEIERMLVHGKQIEVSDAAKVRALERAVERKAPCHHENKNSAADAVLLEVYLECVKTGKGRERFAFITHNKHDFSDMTGDPRIPHPDIASGFSKIKSLYFLTLRDFLRRIDPRIVEEAIWEHNYDPPIRSLSEVLTAMDFLTDQVWYNRHKNFAWKIKHRKHKIVTDKEWAKGHAAKGWGYSRDHTPESVWEGAQRAAEGKEEEHGKKNLGPWTDFEWGMINGKLSGLRWSLGDEWDMLDT